MRRRQEVLSQSTRVCVLHAERLSRHSSLGGSVCGSLGLLLGVELSGLGAAGILHLDNEVAVLPANAGGEVGNHAVAAVGSQAGGTECVGHYHALDLLVLVGDSLENLQAGQGGLTTGSLVRDHSADDTVHDHSWGTVMEWALLGVGVHSLAQERVELDGVALDCKNRG